MDADRLEAPGRRILWRTLTISERAADHGGEIGGSMKRTRGDDSASHPA